MNNNKRQCRTKSWERPRTLDVFGVERFMLAALIRNSLMKKLRHDLTF